MELFLQEPVSRCPRTVGPPAFITSEFGKVDLVQQLLTRDFVFYNLRLQQGSSLRAHTDELDKTGTPCRGDSADPGSDASWPAVGS